MRTPDLSSRTANILQSVRLAAPSPSLGNADDADAYDPTLPAAESRRIVGAALLCGAMGEFLLRPAPGVGVGVTVMLLCVGGAIVSVAYRRTGSLSGSVQFPLLAALPFALLIAVRDNGMLTAWNIASAAGALALAADAVAPASMLQLTNARLRDVLRRFSRSLRHLAVGAVPLVREDAIAAVRGYSRRWYAVRLVARAALLAIVLATSFGALLASGDPVFRHLFAWTVAWSPEALLVHTMGVFGWTWPVAGFLRGALRDPPPVRSNVVAPTASLGLVDATAALGAVNATFAVFLLVQLRVLFGGQSYVMATTGLTLAEYARSGFFVLVATAGIVVLLLLAVNALLGNGIISQRPAVRRQAYGLIGLTGVLLLSAIWRMVLYVDGFGLSLDRVYALAALCWIGSVLALFAFTLLRGRASRFAFGVVVSGWMTLLAVNAANPDALVAADSARRAERHLEIDWRYLTHNVGADAVPRVVKLLLQPPGTAAAAPSDAMLPSPRYLAARDLISTYGSGAVPLRAAWSLADARARDTVRVNEAALLQVPMH